MPLVTVHTQNLKAVMDELQAARQVVEAARSASALIGWDDGTTAKKLDAALDNYDAATRNATEEDK